MSTDMGTILVVILFIHLIAFLIVSFQVINLLEEIAFPSDDPIMTSTLEGFTDIDEEEPVEKEPAKEEPVEEKSTVETQDGWVTVNQLRRMKKDDLIGLCDSMGLDTDGTKNDLVDRISKNQ